jgi:hypothetical protein
VAEAGDSSGTQRKGKVHCWKPLPSNDNEDVTVDTSVCACAHVRNTELQSVSCAALKSPINTVTSPKPVYNHITYM